MGYSWQEVPSDTIRVATGGAIQLVEPVKEPVVMPEQTVRLYVVFTKSENATLEQQVEALAETVEMSVRLYDRTGNAAVIQTTARFIPVIAKTPGVSEVRQETEAELTGSVNPESERTTEDNPEQTVSKQTGSETGESVKTEEAESDANEEVHSDVSEEIQSDESEQIESNGRAESESAKSEETESGASEEAHSDVSTEVETVESEETGPDGSEDVQLTESAETESDESAEAVTEKNTGADGAAGDDTEEELTQSPGIAEDDSENDMQGIVSGVNEQTIQTAEVTVTPVPANAGQTGSKVTFAILGGFIILVAVFLIIRRR